jgi:hypothetical protein
MYTRELQFSTITLTLGMRGYLSINTSADVSKFKILTITCLNDEAGARGHGW